MINSHIIGSVTWYHQSLYLSEIHELQLKIHLYICSTSDQISEHIFEEIKNFSDTYHTYYKGSEEEFSEFITTPNLIYDEPAAELILRAVSKCFACKVVLFSEDAAEYNVIVETNLTNLPKIYLQQTLSASYFFLTFKSEDTTSYDNLNIQSTLLFDNSGRAHLKTPHSGPMEIYLRAQKFNSTTAVTHVNDVLPMLKRKSKKTKNLFSLFFPTMVQISIHQHWLTPYTITDSFVIYEWRCYQYWPMPQDTLPAIQLNTCGLHSVMPLLELFYRHAFQVSHYHQQNNQQKCRPLRKVEVKRKSFLIMQCLLVLLIGKIWLLTTFQ